MSPEHSETEILDLAMRSTMEMIKDAKVRACEENKGHTDLNPMLIIGIDAKHPETGEDAIGGQMVEMCLSNGEHPVDALPKMLSDLSESGLTKFHFLMFFVEGFARRVENPNGEKSYANLYQDTEYERGSLEKDFHENPASDVAEGLIITAYSWTGEGASATQFYKYGDNGLPVYDDEAEFSTYEQGNEQQGRVCDVFHKFVKYCHLVEMSNK